MAEKMVLKVVTGKEVRGWSEAGKKGPPWIYFTRTLWSVSLLPYPELFLVKK